MATSHPPPKGYVPYLPKPTYGRDLLQGVDKSLRSSALVCTQPEPWALSKGAFPPSTTVHLVTDVDHATVKARCDAWKEQISTGKLAKVTAVFGIGGGMAMDHAKFASRVLGVPLVLCPSILSVDAGFTVAAGVRETKQDSKGASKVSVVYVGDTRPKALLVDFKLLQAAPAILNQSGVGDLLSCATALWDWEAARDRLGERFDDKLAARTRVLIDRLLASAKDLRDVTEEGLRVLSELFADEVFVSEVWGNARNEEGSEHFIAYHLENITGKHYLHGQLVCLCVILAGAYQGQDMQRFIDFIHAVGIDCSLKAVGTSRDELYQVLTTMGDFVASEPQLLPGVFHFKGSVPPAEAKALLDLVDTAFPSSAHTRTYVQSALARL